MIGQIETAVQTTFLRAPTLAERGAAKEFEAVLLTGFVENMLPDNTGGSDLNGPGADIWKSFLAQAIAGQLATQNLTGLSNLVAANLSLANKSSIRSSIHGA